MSFKDHFSNHAAVYAAARPDYPQALFSFLKSQLPQAQRVWDCATGNGQAAVQLAALFPEIVATDASSAQIEQAVEHQGVAYRVASAEAFADTWQGDGFQLVTVAQALHWFERDRFFAAVDRLLDRNGMLAVWSYGLQRIAPAIDALIDSFYDETLGPYWPPERMLVQNAYRDISFPYERVDTPALSMQKTWTLEQQLAYLESWSALQRFRQQRGKDPLPALAQELDRLWNEGDCLTRKVSWPLTFILRQKH